MQPDCGVVIVAAGSGTRMGGEIPKQFRELLGVPLYMWAVRFFDDCPEVRETVIVVPPGSEEVVGAISRKHGALKVTSAVAGGERRQDSVEAGVGALSRNCVLVAVHDAARPFPPRNMAEGLRLARHSGAALFAAPVTDTIKRVEDMVIRDTVDREKLWSAQTPQMFRRDLLTAALRHCRQSQLEITDDASAVAAIGGTVSVIAGPRTNIKITTAEDWQIAEAYAAAMHGGKL
jgi:2-C-methyl-D-erythritol 4-phosphate cytidylyltransferase